jgi:predicted NBD/HSP70 family sugar kinase
MKQGINNLEVKKLNRNRVFRYVNSQSETCMPDIAAALDMSSPTVLTIINELKAANVVKEVGVYGSTGGRKAKALASVKEARYAIGLDITQNHVSLVYTDLGYKPLGHERIYLPFAFTGAYFRTVQGLISDFIKKNEVPEERIEGIGIAVPGIVDGTSRTITVSHVLGLQNITEEQWLRNMPYPCEVINDANAAALAESFSYKNKENMVYLSLSNSVGGAVMFADNFHSRTGWSGGNGNAMYLGDHWRSGEFGHMMIRPGGKKCYCGKKGCLDAYCSANVLADLEGGKLEAFFQKLDEGNETYRKVWREYLDNLAIAVNNLRMCYDCKVVLGGYVGNFMGYYLPDIRQMAAEYNLFGEGDYIQACRHKMEASAFGAALCMIEKYISTI